MCSTSASGWRLAGPKPSRRKCAIATIAAAHVAVACRNFLGVEYHLIETEWAGAYVRRDVPLFRDGHVVLTDAPGLGVELDLDVCRRHLAPGETLLA